jgi:uncharacterized protein YdaU (DUF1376 family)
MNKPWFKFIATDWLSGSIQLLSDAEKGTYIDILAMIWKENGSIKRDKVLARKLRIDYATACDRIDSYCDLDILVCENDCLSVKFISDQLNSLSEVSKKNSENASKRWEKKKTPMRPNANKKRKEEIREDKKTKAKKVFVPPTYVEFLAYCKSEGFSDIAERAFKGYEAGDWHDAKGTKIIRWKQKLQNGWFKAENKDKPKTENDDIMGLMR